MPGVVIALLRRLSLAAILVGTVVPADAADRPVRLQVPPDLETDLAALPTILDPADDAERRINAALKRLDVTIRKAAKACRADAKDRGSWERSIDASMRGPRFLSYAITDSVFCGGAHAKR